MKITINKDFTSVSEVSAVRSALKAFKAMYTDADLLSFAEELVKTHFPGRILEAVVEGYNCGFTTGICVEMLIFEEFGQLRKIRYHGTYSEDTGFEVDERDIMFTTHVYRYSAE